MKEELPQGRTRSVFLVVSFASDLPESDVLDELDVVPAVGHVQEETVQE